MENSSDSESEHYRVHPDNMATCADPAKDNEIMSDVGVRERNLTVKGKEEYIRKLKAKRTTTLSASSKLRTRLTEFMSNEENLHLVKSSLIELDKLFTQFQSLHEAIGEQLTSDEDKDKEYDYFISKQSAALEFKNQVMQWIELAEGRLTDKADTSQYGSSISSKRSRSSRHSSKGSAAFSRERERVKLAEMQAEKSMLRKKYEFQAALEELELETKIAKSRARERVYAMIEIEETAKESASLPNASPIMKSTPLWVMKAAQSTANVLTEPMMEKDPLKSLVIATERSEMEYHNDTLTKGNRAESGDAPRELNKTEHPDPIEEENDEKRPETVAEQPSVSFEQTQMERNATQRHDTTEQRETPSSEVSTQRTEDLQTNTSAQVNTSHHVSLDERTALRNENATKRNEVVAVNTSHHVSLDDRTVLPNENETKRNEVVGANELAQVNVVSRHANVEELAVLCNKTQRNEAISNNAKDQNGTVGVFTDKTITERTLENGASPKERIETSKSIADQGINTEGIYTASSTNSTSPMLSSTMFAEQTLSSLMTTQLEQHKQMISSHREMATAMRLPQPKVPTFKGDVIEYKAFIMAFDSRIKSKTTSNADRLYYLHQHLIGEPKDLIEGCLHLDSDEGYTEARRLLEKEYGDPYKISVAYTNQLSKWPPVKYDDAAALKRLSLFLVKCKNAMKTVSYMDVLNHTPHMQAIVQKLPTYLQGKWREEVLNIKMKQQRSAKFSDIVRFLDHASEISNDPVYSKDALTKFDERSKNVKSSDESKKKPSFKPKAGSLATSVTTPNNGPDGAGSVQQQRMTTKCPLCEKVHDLEDCRDFCKKSLDDKKKFLIENSLCFACYGTNHRSKVCTNKKVCKKCNKPHPTALHVENFNVKDQGNSGKPDSKQVTSRISSTCTDIVQPSRATNSVVLQAILPVKVTAKNGNSATTYALYDNGSSGSFITESLKEELDVEGIDTVLQLGTMHGQSSVRSFIVKELVITDLKDDNAITLARCYTRHEIPVSKQQIPTPEVISGLENLHAISNEIPDLIPDVEIGLLIGSDCPLALEPLEVLPSGGKGPFAMRLRHGWTVNGPLQLDLHPSKVCNTNTITVKELESIKEVMTPKSVLEMFELDFNDHVASCDTLSLSKEDKKFLEIASQGIRLTDGHYELPLPFRDPEVMLPNNREQAVKRANWQRKKMLRNEKYRRDYTSFINDTIAKGYARKVPEERADAETGRMWYIPHHGVYHPKKPEKIRVVFDCSAKYDGVSLNDTLLQGPNLTNSLVGVLTRFRQDPVAFMADIEQMFYQVRVPERQHNFLRFLWWPEGDLSAELQEYEMTVHLFGAASSPSCANFALRQVCNDNESEFDSQVTDTISKNFYVDDCLRSVKDKTTAIELVKNVKQACAKGGFNLTKFVCNDREVLESIPQEQRSKEVKTLDLQHDDLPLERALGVQWCVESDQLKFRITISEKPLTRRGILSTVSSIYDPLGIAAPFTFVAKKLLQDLCRDKTIGWDSEIPNKYLVRWAQWRRELPMLEKFALDRCVTPPGFGDVISQEVHIFSDASSTGYGAVAYLRQCNEEGRIHCSFLIGKARLAPVKTTTIPRLELTAATVSARIGQILKTELNGNPSFKYHTDSTTVLRYIANQQTRFKVFVANRVQTILNLSDASQWRYVGTKENPADDASRGLDGQSLLDNQRWLNGPAFLWKPEEEWPEQPFVMCEIPEDDPEVRVTITSNATKVTQETDKAVDKLIQHYSDWYRLKKAVAVFLRVRKILLKRRETRMQSASDIEAKCQTTDNDDKVAEHQPGRQSSNSLTVQDLQEAEIAILQYIQSQTYQNEIQVINQIEGSKYAGGEPKIFGQLRVYSKHLLLPSAACLQ